VESLLCNSRGLDFDINQRGNSKIFSSNFNGSSHISDVDTCSMKLMVST